MVDTRGVVRLGMPGNEKPKMGELNRFLTEYCKLWKSIGYKLELEDAVLDMIQSDCPTQRERFTAVLQKWLELDVGATWKTLELSITNARREELSLEALPEMPVQQPDGRSKRNDAKSQEKQTSSTSDLLSVHFSSFVMTIRKLLEKCKDKLEECKELCSNLTISGNSDVLLFSDEQLAEINHCTSFQQLFTILRKHWNWKEYSILKGIITECASYEAKDELHKFEKLMGSYYGMKLISDEYSPSELPVNYVKLCITVDQPYKDLTLQQYDELRTFIFEHLDVKKYIALPFIKFLFTSLHLEWYIPMQAVSHMIKSMHRNENVFIQKSVVLIKIDDKSILDMQGNSSLSDNSKLDQTVGAHIPSFSISKECDHLMCPVCYQLFKNPKYLSCHHSYCEECLEKIKERSKIMCPDCRKETAIPARGVKDLQNNYLLNHLVNKLILNYKLENETELRCEECDEDDPVIAFCTDGCKLFLCHFCKESHKYSKSHCSHNLISSTELRSNEDLIQSKSKFPTCQEHDLELEYYCETCEKLVCVLCTGEHEDHTYDVVKKIANNCKLYEATASVEVLIEDLSKTYDETDKMRTAIRQQGEEVEKEIDLYYEEAFQKLLKQKEQVKQQVHDTVLQKVKAVTMQLKEVTDMQTRILNTKRIRDSLQKDSYKEVLSVKDHLVSTVKTLRERCKVMGTKPIESANVEVTPVNQPLPQIMKHFTTIDSLSFEVRKFNRFVQQGQMAVLEIITKDNKGNYYSRGGCKVAVEIDPMTSLRETNSVEAIDNDDGTYMIHYMAQRVGEIKLSVFMNLHEITGSRFTIVVQASKPNKIINHDGIACSNSGTWAVADWKKNCVRVFDSQDRLINKFGNQGNRKGQFKYPCDVAFDDNNELYVTDSHNHRVQKFDSHGNYLLRFGGRGDGDGQLNYPAGITTHQDKVYIADRENHRISVFLNNGKFCAVIGQHHLSKCFDIAVNINSEILAADWGHHCVYIFSTDGDFISDMTLHTENDTLELKKPCSITTDSDDSILITDLDDHCVSIFDETGDRICCFGSEGSELDHSQHGIAIGPDGTIYVSDTINKGVKIFPAYDDMLSLMHAYFVDYHGKYKVPLDL